jgi:hypothetical protein
MNYILNLFGTGIRYWICEIPISVFEEMTRIQIKQKVGWEQLLFDFDFLKHFGYNHWSELSNQSEQTGFLLDPQNRIEIKQGSKFIARFRANELTNHETLFPLYQTTHSELSYPKNSGCQTMVLIQFEKGLISKYKFESNLFTINDLSFNTSSLEGMYFLKDIDLSQTELVSTSDDCVTISSLVLIL